MRGSRKVLTRSLLAVVALVLTRSLRIACLSLEEAQEVVEDRDGVVTRTAWPSPYIVMPTRMRPTHNSRGNNAELRVLLLKWCRKKGDLWRVESQFCKPTDISSEHFLRTCTQVRRNVRKSDVVYACKKKKNATEVTVPGIDDFTLRNGAFIAPGPPMCSPLFLPKESSRTFSVVFVNVMHFWG